MRKTTFSLKKTAQTMLSDLGATLAISKNYFLQWRMPLQQAAAKVI